MIRAFLAIDVNDECRHQLALAQETMRRCGVKASWVSEKNMHVSLEFLGDMDEKRIPDLAGMMASAAKECSSFSISIQGIGTFGPPKAPRVIWAGVEAPAVLFDLQATLRAGLSRQNFHIEHRTYHPHITLARLRPTRGKGTLPAEQIMTDAGNSLHRAVPVKVMEIRLMQSRLKPSGAEYTLVHSVSLHP